MAHEELATEIRKHVENDTAVFGFQETARLLRKAGVTKVILAKNCSKAQADDINQLASLGKIKVEHTGLTNEELGIICKRQHAVTVLGLTKE